ncbi:hypothetical protein B0H19DRAFT_1255889 [Mycena capillaripes]|nr:hypothetical protein B0H19DRAFT_1255889 [Mycena capillaripes]
MTWLSHLGLSSRTTPMLTWRILRLPASARPSSSLATIARRGFPPEARLSESSDFRCLRAPDSIYVDKSRYLKAFLSFRNALHVNFFGLEPSTRDERVALFSGLAIKEDYPSLWKSHFGKYPVLHLSFKDLNVTSYETFCSSLANCVRHVAEKFDKLDYFKNITSPYHVEDLRSLIVVLIDEYDSPIAHAAKTGDATLLQQITADMIMFMSRLLKASLDPLRSPILFISRALLVGVSQIAESGYLHRLNNLQIFGVANEQYAAACYFSAVDVEELYHHCAANTYVGPVPFNLTQLQEHYHGYRTPPPSSTPLYIPFAVTGALNGGALLPVWTLSGRDDLLRNMLMQVSKTDPTAFQDFHRLLSNETIGFGYRPAKRYGHPATANEFWSIMLDSGYIAPADKLHQFKIPNPDVSEALFHWVPYLMRSGGPATEEDQLAIAFLEGNARNLYSIFSSLLIQLDTNLTTSNKKYSYHCFTFGILLSACRHLKMTCRVEQSGGHGCLDLVLVHKESASIIEFKAARSEASLTTEARDGCNQIRTRQYAARLPASVKRVTEIGIACHHQHTAVGCRVRTRSGVLSRPAGGWVDQDDAVQIMTADIYDQDTLHI